MSEEKFILLFLICLIYELYDFDKLKKKKKITIL